MQSNDKQVILDKQTYDSTLNDIDLLRNKQNEIYIIKYLIFTAHGYLDDAFVNDTFFTSKQQAIECLEYQDFKHICDDEYADPYNNNAEIILLKRHKGDFTNG